MRAKTLVSLAVALSLVFAAAAFAADEAPAKKYGEEVGEFIKPVQLKIANSDQVIKTDELKKTTVFMLVASVCTACRLELEEMEANAKEFGDKADLYAVVIDMDPTAAVERLKTKISAVGIITDSEYALGRVVNMVSAPSAVIVNTEGKIILKKYGYAQGQWKEYARAVFKK